jgi:photosystem II stability/assembly factor-like uncharacterized protein
MLRLSRVLAALLLGGAAFIPPASATDYEFEWANPKPQGNAINAFAFESATVGYAVGDQGATLRTTDGGQTWTPLTRYPEFQNHLRDVMVLAPGQLLAGGGQGLYRSTDAGATWSLAQISSFVVQDLAVVPGAGPILSAIGDFGQILRSTDGGNTWQVTGSPGIRNLRSQFWLDANTGYIAGENVARRTTDGGNTWLPLSGINEQGTYTDVFFADPMNGWILEHFTTFRTTDGGASWFPKHGPFGQSPFYQEEALFLDVNHRFVITLLEGAGIWETTDDGLHWTQRYERLNTQGYTEIQKLANGTFIVTSTDGDLLRSTDSGLTWTNFTTSPGDGERTRLQALAVLPSGKAFCGGMNGVWLRSTDTGSSWSFAPGLGFDTPITITFRNDQLGLVGVYGPAGQTKVARTTDGGATWVAHSVSPTYAGYVQQIAFPTDQIAYAVTNGGTGFNFVFRSTDGGQTWALRNQGVSNNLGLRSIFFVDANTGYVGGGDFNFATLWKTTDGGASWSAVPQAGLVQAEVTDMFWSDATHGLVATFSGASRTTDGGQSWAGAIFTPLWRLAFRDAFHGYAGSYFDRRVLETQDGGISWAIINTPWTSAPYDLKATPDGFLLCGEGSVILKARAVTTSVDASEVPGLDRRLAVAIWPNPSRGRSESVTFGIQAPAAGPVELRIYDVGGRLIESMTRRVNAGAAAIAWNPGAWSGDRAAGTYFVEARFAGGEEARGRFVLVP